jgi:hypothetical protein
MGKKSVFHRFYTYAFGRLDVNVVQLDSAKCPLFRGIMKWSEVTVDAWYTPLKTL